MLGHIGVAKCALRAWFAQFEEGKAKFLDHFGCGSESGCRIAVITALRIAIGREAYADPVRAPNIDQTLQYLAQQAHAVFSRPAIFILAQIGAIANELIDQIAIGTVQLDPVKTGLFGIGSGAAVILDQARDFFNRQSARLSIF